MIPKKEEEHRGGQQTQSSDLVIIQEIGAHSDQPIKRYSKGKLLGKGGFAKCFEFTSLDTRKVYAAKVIEKASLTRSKAKQKLTSQIRIHRSLKFQYIVGFQHFFQDSQCVYILLQVCPNQTLNELIKRRKRLTEVQAQCYLFQVALAIKYMHGNRVIHRDLKLGNMFLSDKLEIKIGDFGLAAKLEGEGERRRTMCGTPNYIAPEIIDNSKIEGNVGSSGHSYEVDIWSFGVIAYALLVGKPPFETQDVRSTYNKIKMCNYSFPDSIPISKTAKNFISKMLQLQPSRRLTIQQILNHQFFTSNPFPKTLPISCLACPPNANFMKKFQPKQAQTKKAAQSTDKLNTSRGYEMANTDRIQSLNRDRLLNNIRSSTENTNQPPQRAASSTALVGHKFIAKKSIQQIPVVQPRGPQIWVSHFVQHPKFGMCYLLNNNSTGMNFNDSTALISNCTFTRIKYFELTQRLEQQGAHVYEIGNTESVLAKKMKIILHFNQELRGKREGEEVKMNHQQRFRAERLKYKKETPETAMGVYVKKSVKAPKATIFWFSNKDFQIIFQDSTEILLRNHQAVYVNKFAERKYFMFNEYQTMSEQIQKRMRYALEIIRTFKSKPRTNTASNLAQQSQQPPPNDQNKKPRASSLNLRKQKEKDSKKQRERQLPRNSSYSRFAGNFSGNETDRNR